MKIKFKIHVAQIKNQPEFQEAATVCKWAQISPEILLYVERTIAIYDIF
jgi:hypothetical protein